MCRTALLPIGDVRHMSLLQTISHDTLTYLTAPHASNCLRYEQLRCSYTLLMSLYL